MKTITFYSYKGGVGRSLALANITNRLSEFNKKVCLLDFDLEAPGLPHKFSAHIHPQTITKGIVDYVYEYFVNGNLPESIKEYSYSFKIHNNKEVVNFLPAGYTESTDYWKKLSAINWYKLLYESETGIAFFLDLKEKIRKEFNPDFLLIDSRTGITETSGITMTIMADEVVVVSANNKENLDGAQKIIKSLSNTDNAILGKTPRITFVLSRIPFTDKPEDREKEINLIKRVKKLFDSQTIDNINVIHSDRELEENERLKIGYDKDDQGSSQVSIDYLKLFEAITKNDFSEIEKIRFNEIKKAEKLFARATFDSNIQNKISLINEAIKLDSSNVDYYKVRASAYFANRDYAKAENDYNVVLDISPDSLDAYLSLATIFFYMKKFDKAIDSYKKALSYHVVDATIYADIGTSYICLGDLNSSNEYYTRAIELDPELSAPYNGRGNNYRILGEIDKAFEDVYKSIELDSENAVAFSTLAEIYAQLNKENEFYINIEIALRMADEKRRNKNNSSDFETLEGAIKSDIIYKLYYKKERFLKILEKYNVILLDEEITG